MSANTDHVQGFIGYLHGLLNQRGTASRTAFHSYSHAKPRYEWSCSSLLDAAANYRFPIVSSAEHPPLMRYAGQDSLRANADCLARLKADLCNAFDAGDSGAAELAARAIQVWGGTRGNIKTIQELNRDGGFVAYLERCALSFGSGRRFNSSAFSSPTVLRSNAGFTKIYSLLFEDFAIYDSRVAAALGMLIVRYCAHERLEQVPASLALVWMSGRTPRDPSTGALRNPSAESFTFARCRGAPDRISHMHIRSNVLANSLLSDALPGSEFNQAVLDDPIRFPVTPMRALEAALFMIGYDLRGNPSFGGAVY